MGVVAALIALAAIVSTLAVEWIEIVGFTILVMAALVSTLAVEWIEIAKKKTSSLMTWSPPSRWSGLKF